MYLFLSLLEEDLQKRIVQISETETGISFIFRYDIDRINILHYQMIYEQYEDHSDWYRIDLLDKDSCIFKEVYELIGQYLSVLRQLYKVRT